MYPLERVLLTADALHARVAQLRCVHLIVETKTLLHEQTSSFKFGLVEKLPFTTPFKDLVF